MRNVTRFVFVALAIASIAIGASAQRSRRDAGRSPPSAVDSGTEVAWIPLGERWVDGPCDHDSIQVADSISRPIARIRLRVEESDLELYDIVVTFADGTSFSPPTRLRFDEGERSRQIDLPGGDRVVRRVDFRYGNRPGGGRARVLLFGH